MYCMECNKKIYDCECPGNDERIEKLQASPHVVLNPEGLARRAARKAKEQAEGDES